MLTCKSQVILSQLKFKLASKVNKLLQIYRYKSDNGLLSDLPLLFMVFNGSLSFVGSQIIPAKIKNPNLIVKPGLMGLPQLKPINIETNYIRDFENYYAMHYSLIFDIEIILKTIFKI